MRIFSLGRNCLAPKLKEGIAIVGGGGCTLIRTQHYPAPPQATASQRCSTISGFSLICLMHQYQPTPSTELTEFQSSFLLKNALEIPVMWWHRGTPGPPGTQRPLQPSLQRVPRGRRFKICGEAIRCGEQWDRMSWMVDSDVGIYAYLCIQVFGTCTMCCSLSKGRHLSYRCYSMNNFF